MTKTTAIVLKRHKYIAYIGYIISIEEKLLDIKVAIGLIPMAIFKNNRLYDLLSQMGHNGIIIITEKERFYRL